MHSVRLLSGYDMPTVGLGTWQAKPEEIETVVSTALECGYRHIDTAANYNNEDAIGRALKKWFEKGGTREELFITTKLPHFGNRPADVERFIKLSLEKLGLDYLDMYLVHMPFAFKLDENTCTAATNEDGSYILDFNTDPVSVWKEMEKQVKLGRTRSIGLSNFNEEQISTIWKNAQIKPSNLQVELHAYMQQTPIRELCEKYNIVVTGYSPLGSPAAKTHFQVKYNYTSEAFPDLLNHPIIRNIAAEHKKTAAQVLLRHLLQLGVVIIPKSSSSERIKSNIDLFDFALTEENMKVLSTLDKGSNGRIFNFLFFKGSLVCIKIVEKELHNIPNKHNTLYVLYIGKVFLLFFNAVCTTFYVANDAEVHHDVSSYLMSNRKSILQLLFNARQYFMILFRAYLLMNQTLRLLM